MLRTRRWPFLGTTFAVSLLVTLMTLAMRPVYRATSLLLIEPKGMNVAKVEGVYDPIVAGMALNDYYRTQFEILRSRRIVEPVAMALKVPERAEFKDAHDPIQAFTTTLSIEPIRESRLVRVSIESGDRDFATNAANAIVERFVEDNNERTLGVSDTGLKKLKEMERSLRPKYEAAAHALQEFKDSNSIYLLDETESIAVQQLKVLSEEISKARADRARCAGEAKIVRAAMKDGRFAGGFPEVTAFHALDELKVELAKTEQARDELLKHYTADHPAVRGAEARVQRAREAYQGEVAVLVDGYEKRLTAEDERVAELEQAIKAAEGRVAELGRKAVRLQFLKEEFDAVGASYKNVARRIEEVEVSIATGTKENNLFVVDPALVPKEAVRPRKTLNVALGTVFGAVLGFLLCFLIEYLDQTIKTKEDAERILRFPVLGFVPKGEGADPIELAAIDHPRGAVAEAFRSIRTGLAFTLPQARSTALLVTSSAPGEGKSFVSVNLAFALAQTGKRVLLVDADMRRPRLHTIFGLGDQPVGLSTMLVRGVASGLEGVSPTRIPSLDVITAGPLPPNPAELLGGEGTRAFLEKALAAYDWVILDAPPVTVVADPMILMSQVRHAVFVVRSFATDKRAAARARELLVQSPGTVAGLVLNVVDAESKDPSYYGGYRYSHYARGRETPDGTREPTNGARTS